MSTEVSQHRPNARSNRAVTAVNEARGNISSRFAPLFPSMGPCPVPDPDAEPTVQYTTFEEMLNAVKQPNPLAALKEKLESMKEVPKQADESARLPDHAWRSVIAFAGSAASREAVHLSATCRRLRAIVLRSALETSAFASVNVVPHLLSLSELADANTFSSVAAFLSAPGRAAQVHHFALIESKYASTVPWNHAHFPTPCALSPALDLVARLPQLRTLDMRGVAWDCRSGARLSLLLPDLYLVAPQLETLKIGRDVMALWVPRWWEQLPHLKALVIASRREQPMPANSLGPNQEDVGNRSATGAGHDAGAVPPPLELSQDFMELLSAEKRRWSIKLWCPLSAESAQQLLFPASPHTSLTELTLNVAGPSAAALLTSCASASLSTGDTAESAAKKAKTKKSVAQEVDVALLPSLTTLTVANIDVLPELAPQLFQRLCGALAPNLVHVNICNTVCVPVPDKKPKRKPAPTTEVTAVA